MIMEVEYLFIPNDHIKNILSRIVAISLFSRISDITIFQSIIINMSVTAGVKEELAAAPPICFLVVKIEYAFYRRCL